MLVMMLAMMTTVMLMRLMIVSGFVCLLLLCLMCLGLSECSDFGHKFVVLYVMASMRSPARVGPNSLY